MFYNFFLDSFSQIDFPLHDFFLYFLRNWTVLDLIIFPIFRNSLAASGSASSSWWRFLCLFFPFLLWINSSFLPLFLQLLLPLHSFERHMVYLLSLDNLLLLAGFLLLFRTGRRLLNLFFLGQIGEPPSYSAVGPGSGFLIVLALAHILAHKYYSGECNKPMTQYHFEQYFWIHLCWSASSKLILSSGFFARRFLMKSFTSSDRDLGNFRSTFNIFL